MNINFRVTPVAGPVTVTFADDFLIDLQFLDVKTGEVVHDFAGPKAVRLSQVLASLPQDALAAIARDQAVDLVRIANGIS